MKVEILDAIMGSGKALLNGTPVVSENGYVPIEDLKVGDKVYGEDGKLHTVLGVYPQGRKKMYKVTFSDRNSVVCCGEHLWTYQLPSDKAKGIFRTDSLSEIMKKPLYRQTNKCKNWQFFIPVSEPVEFSKKELTIDPYLLGLFLGDGGLGETITFTNSEPDIQERFKKLVGGEYAVYSGNNTLGFKIRSKSTVGVKLRQIFNRSIRSSSKFIPDEFKLSSVQDRLALIKGLIDTDGYCAGGYFEYVTVSNQLANDLKFVLESVGCTVTLSSKTYPKYIYKGKELHGQCAYRLFIRHNNLTLLCSSQKHLQKIKTVNTKPNRSIRDIEFVGEDECTCIMVDNPSKLFLTEHFIPTHNTTAICKWMDDLSIKDSSSKFFYISPLLSEVEENGGRIHKQCNHVKFVSPESKGRSSKSDHLLELLQDGVNIACTHKLYLNMDVRHFNVMKEYGYNLIIDEEIGMIEGYNAYSQADCDFLIEQECIGKQDNDGMLVWLKDSESFHKADHKYYEFKKNIENGLIYACKSSNSMMVTQLPVRLLEVAKRIIILTYMFEGNILSSFLKLKGIEYTPFTEVSLNTISKDDIKPLIKLHQPRQFRQWKFMDYLPLTYTWYSGKTGIKEKRITNQDVLNITKYIKSVKHACGADWNEVLYTFPKCRSLLDKDSRMAKINPEDLKKVEVLESKQTWLSSNTRATNTLSHKRCLVHCYNRYPTQSVMQYLRDYGVEIDNDVFAISEMVQWIWRSCIRNQEEIYLAIASKRMRFLFLNWLHDLPLDNEDYTHFADYLNKCKNT